MDIATFAQATHDAATAEKTGVIALVTSVLTILGGGVGLLKIGSEIRKLRAEVPKLASETVLNQLKAEAVRLEVRKLGGQEIQSRLDCIRSNATKLYNELYAVYKPCLSGRPKKLTKPEENKIKDFVNERKYLQEIEPAVNYLGESVKDSNASALTRVVEVAHRFLHMVGASRGLQILERIIEAKGQISREFSIEMQDWLDEVRKLHDELATSTGIRPPESRSET